jgi:hypothetical protein
VPFVGLEVLGFSGFVGFFFFLGWFGDSCVLRSALRFVLIKVLVLIKKKIVVRILLY